VTRGAAERSTRSAGCKGQQWSQWSHECLTLHEFVRGSQSNFLAFSIRGLTAYAALGFAKSLKPILAKSSAPQWRQLGVACLAVARIISRARRVSIIPL
jgi:hypothetical protein